MMEHAVDVDRYKYCSEVVSFLLLMECKDTLTHLYNIEERCVEVGTRYAGEKWDSHVFYIFGRRFAIIQLSN